MIKIHPLFVMFSRWTILATLNWRSLNSIAMKPGNDLRSYFPSWILPCFRDDPTQDVLKPTTFSETAPLHVSTFVTNLTQFKRQFLVQNQRLHIRLLSFLFLFALKTSNSDVKSNNSFLQNCSLKEVEIPSVLKQSQKIITWTTFDVQKSG